MTTPDTSRFSWEPRLPTLVATIIFIVAALSLCWPMLQGNFIPGGDQVIAGYSFRHFAAEHFKTYGEVPQWNPYLLGGIPFSAVIGHGDIFYPTAWFRWFLPTGFAMSFGFFFHIALAGFSMYTLVRGLKLSWVAAVVAGVAFQLSGNVSSMLANGHDGKLFVSALAPFAFLALFRAVREGKRSGYGVLALVVGLAILSPAVQVAYYLMFACGMLALWLVFLDPQRRPGMNPLTTLAAALGSVFLGLGIAMIQVFPILSHLKYTPRAEGGESTGWEHAISYSYHIKELPALFLPEFNGNSPIYTGPNWIKSHTEYLGVILLILACLGFRAAKQRGLLLPFAAIAGLFTLVAVAGDTPFYSLWWHLPMMKHVRAAGMAFYLVGLCMAFFAACGVDRLLSGAARSKSLYALLGFFGLIALVGSVGALRGVASAFAFPGDSALGERVSLALSNPNFGQALQSGSMRLLLFVAIGAAILLTIQRGLLKGALAGLALIAVVGFDSWSVLRKFSNPLPPAAELFAADEVISAMQRTPLPFRALDFPYGAQYTSLLMAQSVPVTLGYHGFQSIYFDKLFGREGDDYQYESHPALLDLYAMNYLVLHPSQLPANGVLPGYHKIAGPISTTLGARPSEAVLFQRDTLAPWVRVVARPVKAPTKDLVPTLLSDSFPINSLALVSDTTAYDVTPPKSIPPLSPVKATLKEWRPGLMTVTLDGVDSTGNVLVVAENWYPDWHAKIDGRDAPTLRVNEAMLGVPFPVGAKEISLVFNVPEYQTGKIVTIICTLVALGLIASGRFRQRTVNG